MSGKTVYSRIIEARAAAGLPTSQASIAKDLGIFQSAVAQWKGGGNIKPAHVLAIARQTGVCVEWLYTGRGPKKPPSHDVQVLIDELNSLDPDDRERVLKIARALRAG